MSIPKLVHSISDSECIRVAEKSIKKICDDYKLTFIPFEDFFKQLFYGRENELSPKEQYYLWRYRYDIEVLALDKNRADVEYSNIFQAAIIADVIVRTSTEYVNIRTLEQKDEILLIPLCDMAIKKAKMGNKVITVGLRKHNEQFAITSERIQLYESDPINHAGVVYVN